MFIKMAAHTLVKHRKRSLLILFAVMVSVLVMEVVAGMFYGIRENFYRNLSQESGHVLLSAEGRKSSLNPFSLDFSIDDYRQILEELRAMPEVLNAEAVMSFGSLLQTGDRNIAMAGLGLHPDTGLYESVRNGMITGSFPPDAGTVLISSAIAELLGISYSSEDDQLLGSAEILLVVEDSTGSPFYLAFEPGGVFSTASQDFDENHFLIQHNDAEDLLYLENQTMEIRVLLRNPDSAADIATGLPGRLGEASKSLEIRSYIEVNEGLVSLIEMMDFFVIFMNLFVVIIVATVITNAILMNVFDRTREFGTMRAIGLKRKGLIGMIMTEGLILGASGSLLGLVLGIPVVLYFSVNGIPMGGISDALGMGSSDFYFGYSAFNSLMNASGGIIIALAASLYAALVGSRLSIMEALRYD
ncbi:ABC transporter permease [Spirochaeta dissipatitropha]